ncbi:hypothetical protein ACTJ2Z_000528 [Vibrio vulnificus]|jgi:poly-D-alanine transfer protein DltD|uniref:hypothetical protein n=1 Tax=Vibrio vulnificus TaxID=672 RepID=UPI001CDB78D4|nr:hypothetical protein [Vibrio vulnificus]MCA3937105.1 hypothetical protein [Vibrio vulnificus]
MTDLIIWPSTNITIESTKNVILISIDDDIEDTVKRAAETDNFQEDAEVYLKKLRRLFKMKDYCKNTNSPEHAKDKKLLVTYLKKKKVCPYRSKSEVAAFVEGW